MFLFLPKFSILFLSTIFNKKEAEERESDYYYYYMCTRIFYRKWRIRDARIDRDGDDAPLPLRRRTTTIHTTPVKRF